MNTRLTNLPTFLTFTFPVTAAGTPEQITKKQIGTGLAFVDGGGTAQDTITDTANDLLLYGFAPGDNIVVSGSASNDGTYHIKTVVAGTITLDTKDALTAEGAGATVKIIANVSVPDGIGVRIKAESGNTGDVHIADSAAKALNSAAPPASYVLDAGESIELQVVTTDQIWIDAGTTGDHVEVIFEKLLQS